jgi:hypothetical protein
VNANNQDIGFSPLFIKPTSFANALVQNVGGGNTMVFNDAARRLLQKTGISPEIVSHDWWTYILISGCGGNVFYDPHPSLRYRQHDHNLVGMNTGWAARFIRIRMLWQGRFKKWNDRNIHELNRLHESLTAENKKTLAAFAEARYRWLIPRLIGLKRTGLYRQTFLGNMGLLVAAILNKV